MSISYTVDLSLRCDHPGCHASNSFSMRESRYGARLAAELAAELAGWHVGRKLAQCPAHNPHLKREARP